MKFIRRSTAIGATLAGGLMLSGSTFASTQLAQGYLLGAQEAGSAETPVDRVHRRASAGDPGDL